MNIYSVTQEGMTTYFATKRAAHKFNSAHDEPEEIEAHNFTAADVVNLLDRLARHRDEAGFVTDQDWRIKGPRPA